MYSKVFGLCVHPVCLFIKRKNTPFNFIYKLHPCHDSVPRFYCVSKSFYSRFYFYTTFLSLQVSHPKYFYTMILLLQVSHSTFTPVSKLDAIFLFLCFSTMLPISFFYRLSIYVSYCTCVVVTVLSYSYSLCGCHCL